MTLYPHLTGSGWLLAWTVAAALAVGVQVVAVRHDPLWRLANLPAGLYLVGMVAHTHADLWPTSMKSAVLLGVIPALVLGGYVWFAWTVGERTAALVIGIVPAVLMWWSIKTIIDIANSRLAPITVGGMVAIAVVFVILTEARERW